MLQDPGSAQRKEKSIHNFIDSHLKELQWTAYGLVFVGMSIVLRSVKATTKFRQVSDIPSYFIVKNTRLHGHVRRVSESGNLLVEHVPIIQLNWFSSRKGGDQFEECLYVTPAGVNLTPDAVRWLRETTLGRHVWFQLLQVTDSAVESDVTVWKSWTKGRLSLSEEMVKQGVSLVKHYPNPPVSHAYGQLLTRLLAQEFHAQQRGKGMWQEDRDASRSLPGRIIISSGRYMKQKWNTLFGRSKQ